jgi:endonuclease YncB( thermonuclease family)
MSWPNKLLGILTAGLLSACEVKPPPRPAQPPPAAPPAPAPAAAPSLLDAARRGDPEEVRALIASGADVNETDAEKLTPLHHAAFGGHADVIRLLLDHGAHAEARDAYGFASLHAAARDGRADAVKALVDAGADVNALDGEQLTPAQIAVYMRHQDVADYLFSHGATRDEEETAVATTPASSVAAVPPSVPIARTGGNFRAWISVSGATVDAEFVQCVLDTVVLRQRDDRRVRININLLSPSDQVVARQMEGSAPAITARTPMARPARAPPGESIGARIGELKGWTVLSDCRLLRRAGNDGDSFHVLHNGTEYIFRLYYVDAAETSETFPDRVREQADYFKANTDDTLRLGGKAKEFTERLLGAGPFTVVTQWEDARGNSRLPRQFALVITDQGDLDELLTAEGLVRQYGLRVQSPLGSKKYRRLRQMEEEARQERAGAWGMKNKTSEHSSETRPL